MAAGHGPAGPASLRVPVGIVPESLAMSLATLDGSLHRGCGGRYALQSESVTVRLSGIQRTIDQRDAAEKSATEQIRATYALLTPRQIRQLRESLGLTVGQFAELIYGTPKGIVEGWEKGKYLQNREADALLRTLTDRDTLERRAAKAGVTLPVVVPGPGAEGLVAPPVGAPLAEAAPVEVAPAG